MFTLNNHGSHIENFDMAFCRQINLPKIQNIYLFTLCGHWLNIDQSVEQMFGNRIPLSMNWLIKKSNKPMRISQFENLAQCTHMVNWLVFVSLEVKIAKLVFYFVVSGEYIQKRDTILSFLRIIVFSRHMGLY